MTVRRWILAIAAAILTAVQVYFSVVSSGILVPLLLGLGIVATASVTMSQLAPLLVPLVARLLTPWARRSPIAELAMANLHDAVRRTASCAAPMIVLVSLVMGLQGILDTQTKAAATETIQLTNADLIASGRSVDIAAIKDINGVQLAAPETVVPLSIRLKRGGTSITAPGTVVAVDPNAFRATHRQLPTRGNLTSFDSEGIVFGPGLDDTLVHGTYDSIYTNIDDKPITLHESARMGETLAGVDGFYIDRSIVPDDLLDRSTTALIQLTPTANIDTVRQQLTKAGATTVQTPQNAATDQKKITANENRAVMAAIVGLGSAYALISVLSTLAIAIGQRRSEFATLRLSGVRKFQILQTTVLEALASTIIGLVLGASAAVLALVGLWGATARVYGSPVIATPWGLLASITALVVALTAITALISTRSALKSAPVHALGITE